MKVEMKIVSPKVIVIPDVVSNLLDFVTVSRQNAAPSHRRIETPWRRASC